MDSGGHLAHGREGRGSLFDSSSGALHGRCRIDAGIEAIEKEGIEDLENNVHGWKRYQAGAVFR